MMWMWDVETCLKAERNARGMSRTNLGYDMEKNHKCGEAELKQGLQLLLSFTCSNEEQSLVHDASVICDLAAKATLEGFVCWSAHAELKKLVVAWAPLEGVIRPLLIGKIAGEHVLEDANCVLHYCSLSYREALIKYAKQRELYY